jgi:hypothetical protein
MISLRARTSRLPVRAANTIRQSRRRQTPYWGQVRAERANQSIDRIDAGHRLTPLQPIRRAMS